uniref:Uncharacterized protein n=1 Tax=Romanomermis culicivorax TaxID=13658 RepID=A0A915LDH2_ROMCU
MKKEQDWGWKQQWKAQAYLQSAHWGGQDHVAATEDDMAVLVSTGPCFTTSTSTHEWLNVIKKARSSHKKSQTTLYKVIQMYHQDFIDLKDAQSPVMGGIDKE